MSDELVQLIEDECALERDVQRPAGWYDYECNIDSMAAGTESGSGRSGVAEEDGGYKKWRLSSDAASG